MAETKLRKRKSLRYDDETIYLHIVHNSSDVVGG